MEEIIDVIETGTINAFIVHIEQEDDPLFSMCGRRGNFVMVADPNHTSYERCPHCMSKWDKLVPEQSATSKLLEWYDNEGNEEITEETPGFFDYTNFSVLEARCLVPNAVCTETMQVAMDFAKEHGTTLTGRHITTESYQLPTRMLFDSLSRLSPEVLSETLQVAVKAAPLTHKPSMFLNILLQLSGY